MSDIEKLSREELIKLVLDQRDEQSGGIRLTYPGQTPPWQIVRRVQPRGQRIEAKLCCGEERDQAENLIVEGENLQALVSLYKYRGQVDLILTDPPYNTGQDFRYNDKWDEDPNDPDLGNLVPVDDGSRHSKWLRFMTPRLWMMREALRPSGVLAICIDHRELFRLGILLDSLFGEGNRLAIINWQKTYSPKTTNHVSTATEYVLVYAKDAGIGQTRLLPRDEGMDARYRNKDHDPQGAWKGGDATAPESRTTTVFAVQSPFTGALHYPEGEHVPGSQLGAPTHHWRLARTEIKKSLENCGVKYEERDLGDGRGKALVVRKSSISLGRYDPQSDAAVVQARQKSLRARDAEVWPEFYFSDTNTGGAGEGRPALKRYIDKVAKGRIPWTYWAADDYDDPLVMGSQSWDHEESGHSQAGVAELTAVVGRNHGFTTVKPMKLFKKIIQLWCPPRGIVLDPFAGSGTSGHAVLELNAETGSARRFVLIEQGRPERGDPYARSLTAERVRRAISGERAVGKAEPLPGAFRFSKLTAKVDAVGILALQREEMIDILLTSHWDQTERASAHLSRLPAGAHQYLFAKSVRGEGYFLVWNGPEEPSVLNREAFRTIVAEAQAAGLAQPFHVYARRSTYSGPNVEFYQIPNRILEKLGFNEALHFYGTAEVATADGENAA